MSYHTEKTLSSIRSLIDEWSIRKEGGKQSFFILKEIDKLLADTPVDDVVSSKDVADKKNEVTMLRLQINEHKERRRLDEIEQLELDDVLPSRNELVDRLESVFAVNRQQEDTIDMYKDAVASQNKVLKDFQDEINSEYETAKALRRVIDEIEQEVTKYKTTINELNETIGDLRMAASDMLDTINECSRRESGDSRVLMKVVEAVDTWHRCMIPTSLTGCTDLIKVLDDVLEDYSNTPVVTLKTPSMGTRVVSKNEEAHTIDEAKMRAVHALIGCGDTWVLHIGVVAGEVAKYNQSIDELTETTRKLEGRLSSMYAANSDQSRMAGARVIIDNQATSIDELNDMYCDVCGKLEKIEKIAEHPAYDCFSTALDEIIKIIQEE